MPSILSVEEFLMKYYVAITKADRSICVASPAGWIPIRNRIGIDPWVYQLSPDRQSVVRCINPGGQVTGFYPCKTSQLLTNWASHSNSIGIPASLPYLQPVLILDLRILIGLPCPTEHNPVQLEEQ